jgi:hypothetical protein
MVAFSPEEFGHHRFDAWAIVSGAGTATIDPSRRTACLAWLHRHGYTVDTIDCTRGIHHVILDLGHLLGWESQFGYTLEAKHRNLDALRDGFEFDVPNQGGRVFELIHPDIVWQEDATWLLGLLAIAQEHTRVHLALGRRFFTLLVLPQASPLIGTIIDQTRIPHAFWNSENEIHEFLR